MSYPSDCPVARWAGDGRDYVIAPASWGWPDGDIRERIEAFVTVERTDRSRVNLHFTEFTPLNAAARAVLAVARGGAK